MRGLAWHGVPPSCTGRLDQPIKHKVVNSVCGALDWSSTATLPWAGAGVLCADTVCSALTATRHLRDTAYNVEGQSPLPNLEDFPLLVRAAVIFVGQVSKIESDANLRRTLRIKVGAKRQGKW